MRSASIYFAEKHLKEQALKQNNEKLKRKFTNFERKVIKTLHLKCQTRNNFEF